jgi:hypothetical protein
MLTSGKDGLPATVSSAIRNPRHCCHPDQGFSKIGPKTVSFFEFLGTNDFGKALTLRYR